MYMAINENGYSSNSTLKPLNHDIFRFSDFKSKPTFKFYSNQSSKPFGTKTKLFVPQPIECYNAKIGKNRLHGFRGDVWNCWRTADVHVSLFQVQKS